MPGHGSRVAGTRCHRLVQGVVPGYDIPVSELGICQEPQQVRTGAKGAECLSRNYARGPRFPFCQQLLGTPYHRGGVHLAGLTITLSGAHRS
jgi:hypothetical protein